MHYRRKHRCNLLEPFLDVLKMRQKYAASYHLPSVQNVLNSVKSPKGNKESPLYEVKVSGQVDWLQMSVLIS